VIGDPFWKSEISGTGVANNYAAGIEMLAFPNPVSDQINVRFTLDNSSSVSFDIYDITGKSVKSINAGHFAAGENSVVINRENLNSGIYLLRMSSETNRGITRITLK
jgi:hypothetical protein